MVNPSSRRKRSQSPKSGGAQLLERDMALRLLILFGWLSATTACIAANVAPLGFELGVTTRANLQAGLKGKVELTSLGVNRYSGGPVLDAPGEGLGVEG